MCALFRTAGSDAVDACQLLAECASIEPVLEGCAYIGFIVQLHDFEFERYLPLREAVSRFVYIIEKRIDAQDFSCLYIYPASSKLDTTGKPRVVFNARGRVVYKW